MRYDSAFTFIYSPRRETEAATLADQMPHEVSRERMERLVELVQRHATERAQRFVGPHDGCAGGGSVAHRSVEAARAHPAQQDRELHRRGRARRPRRRGDRGRHEHHAGGRGARSSPARARRRRLRGPDGLGGRGVRPRRRARGRPAAISLSRRSAEPIASNALVASAIFSWRSAELGLAATRSSACGSAARSKLALDQGVQLPWRSLSSRSSASRMRRLLRAPVGLGELIELAAQPSMWASACSSSASWRSAQLVEARCRVSASLLGAPRGVLERRRRAAPARSPSRRSCFLGRPPVTWSAYLLRCLELLARPLALARRSRSSPTLSPGAARSASSSSRVAASGRRSRSASGRRALLLRRRSWLGA